MENLTEKINRLGREHYRNESKRKEMWDARSKLEIRIRKLATKQDALMNAFQAANKARKKETGEAEGYLLTLFIKKR